MTSIDIAYVATAGAIGLALAVVVWAWRIRRAVQLQQRRLDRAEIVHAQTLADTRGAAEAFEGAVIRIEDGEARLASGYDALEAVAAALGLDSLDHPDLATAVVQALADQAADTTQRLTDLIERGEPCRATVQGVTGPVSLEGKALGGSVWLRLDPGADVEPIGDGRLSGLIDAMPTPAWISDASGVLVWANRAWLDAVEQPSVEAARASGATFDKDGSALVVEALEAAKRIERFRWAVLAGRRRAWRVSAAPIGQGEVLSFAIDVTETEETRETLRQHVAAHDETLDHLDDAVAIFGANRRLAYHNSSFRDLFSLDAVWLDERPTHAEMLDRLRQRRKLPETVDYSSWKARELEYYGRTEVAPDDVWPLPDGRTLRVVRQPHPLGGLLLLFADITDELKLRAQYNALLNVQQATLDKLNDAVAVFGSDGRLRLRNDAFEQFWGLAAEQFDDAGDFEGVSRLCLTLLPETGIWTELGARVTDPDPESRAPVSGEARLTDRRIVAWQTRPLPDGATLIAFSDITARRELEDALEQKKLALGEAERLKREFVGNVSYELRTPLTTIIGYAELLEAQGSGLPDRSRQHLAAVRAAADQLAHSIDDVLDMAQIDAGEMALTLGDVRIADVLAAAAARIEEPLRARGAGLIIEVDETAGLIRADAQRLSKILDQLADNAVRALESGGEVALRAQGQADRVRISVSDTGRGVPFHKQAHVFDRFVGRDRGGPGLGLALVKAITEMHGGTVSLRSDPGHGTEFILDLPREATGRQAVPELQLDAG